MNRGNGYSIDAVPLYILPGPYGPRGPARAWRTRAQGERLGAAIESLQEIPVLLKGYILIYLDVFSLCYAQASGGVMCRL